MCVTWCVCVCTCVCVWPAGIGKTALAVATGHYLRNRNHFPDGVFLVDLSTTELDFSQLRARLAAALNRSEQVWCAVYNLSFFCFLIFPLLAPHGSLSPF